MQIQAACRSVRRPCRLLGPPTAKMARVPPCDRRVDIVRILPVVVRAPSWDDRTTPAFDPGLSSPRTVTLAWWRLQLPRRGAAGG